MNVRTKKSVLLSILITITVIILLMGGFMLYKYSAVNALCEKIRAGEEIHTDIGNGLTAPRWLEPISRITQTEGPQTPLKVACYYRNVQAVQVLLENGADPNFFFKHCFSPLEAAIVNGPVDQNSVEIVKLLIEHGADINGYGSEAPILIMLSDRIGSGNPYVYELFNLLLDFGADCSFNGYNRVMFDVVRFGSIEIATDYFGTRQYNINDTDPRKQGALIVAVQREDAVDKTELVKLLLLHGADKSITDQDGYTAYDYAVQKGYDEIASLLS